MSYHFRCKVISNGADCINGVIEQARYIRRIRHPKPNQGENTHLGSKDTVGGFFYATVVGRKSSPYCSMKVGNRRRNMESKSFRNFSFSFLRRKGAACFSGHRPALQSLFGLPACISLRFVCYILGIQIKAVAYILVLYPDAFAGAH